MIRETMMKNLTLKRRGLLAGSAALAAKRRMGRAAAPVGGGKQRMSVDQAANVQNPRLTRVNPE